MKQEYYSSSKSVKEYIAAAKDVNSEPLVNKFKEFLKEGSSVLELGSGPGTDWQILSKGYEVTGSDMSEAFLSHLKAQNPSGNFIELDAATLDTEVKFDGIYSNKVLHHLTDEELVQSVARQAEILNPNGVICHSFWKGEGTEEFKGMFVNSHNKEELKKEFETKFEILSMELYEEFEPNDSIVLIAQKK